jgi:hypothetical protein
MVNAARRYNRIVQAGMQHRSSPYFREVEKIVQSSALGKVHWVGFGITPTCFRRGSDTSLIPSRPPASIGISILVRSAQVPPNNHWSASS